MRAMWPWVEMIWEWVKLVVFWFVNKREFQLLRATRQLRVACGLFEQALTKNAVVQQMTRRELEGDKQERDDLRDQLSTSIHNHVANMKLEATRRGHPVATFTALHTLQLLSSEEMEVYERVGLLESKIQCKVQHLESLRGIGHTLHASYDKCSNHMTCIRLANHVADISQIIGGLKLEGLDMVTSRLADNVDTILNTTTEVNEHMDEETGEIRDIFGGLHAERKGVNLMDEMLQSVEGMWTSSPSLMESHTD